MSFSLQTQKHFAHWKGGLYRIMVWEGGWNTICSRVSVDVICHSVGDKLSGEGVGVHTEAGEPRDVI